MSDSPFTGPPFAGCTMMVDVATTVDIRNITAILTKCGHQHNFAIELGSRRPRVWCSPRALECIRSYNDSYSDSDSEDIAAGRCICGSWQLDGFARRDCPIHGDDHG